MSSNDQLEKFASTLASAGVSNPSAAVNYLFYWTNDHPSLTNILVDKICEKPDQAWDAVSVAALVERTFFWPETLAKLQQGSTGQAVANYPQKKELLETYLSIFGGFGVLADRNSPVQQELERLGLVRTENGYLETDNRIYAKIFDQDWAKAQLVEPTVWDDLRPWATPKLIGIGLWSIILIGAVILLFSWMRRNVTRNEPVVAQVTAVVPPTEAATRTQTAIPTDVPTGNRPTEIPAILPTNTLRPATASPTKEPTATLRPTAVPTQSVTETPTESLATTATITSTATAEATEAAEVVYPRPQVLNLYCYQEWKNFAPDGQIPLKWRWAGRLYGSQYLEIRVGPQGGNLSSIGRVFAKPNAGVYEWRITPQGYFLDGTTQNFQWQVVHMAANGRTMLAQSARGCFTVK